MFLGLAGIGLAQENPGSGIAPQPAPVIAPESAPVATSSPSPAAQTPQKPFYKKLFTTQAVMSTLPGAAVQQFHDWPGEWGKSGAGFEKRAASLYGQFVIGALIEDGVKTVHKEDTRYRRLGEGNFFKRTGHAITTTFVAHRPDGTGTPAFSVLANSYGSWAIATLWSPREFRTPGSIAQWGTAGLGVTVVADVLREFWPDLKKRLHSK